MPYLHNFGAVASDCEIRTWSIWLALRPATSIVASTNQNLPGIKLRTSLAKSAGQFVRTLGHTCRGGVGGGTERHASANGRAEVELRFD